MKNLKSSDWTPEPLEAEFKCPTLAKRSVCKGRAVFFGTGPELPKLKV